MRGDRPLDGLRVNDQVKAARLLWNLFEGQDSNGFFCFRRDNDELTREENVSGEEINRRRDQLLGANFQLNAASNKHPLANEVVIAGYEKVSETSVVTLWRPREWWD